MADVQVTVSAFKRRRRRPLAVRLFTRRSVQVAAVVVVALVVGALFAPIFPRDPAEQFAEHLLEAPSLAFPLGTDSLGRDQLARLIHGGRISLMAGFSIAFIAMAIGVVLGLVAGYRLGWVDRVIAIGVDTLLAFPALLLAITIAASLGAGLSTAVLAITAVEIPKFQRIMRAQVLGLRGAEFIRASRAIGASPLRIMVGHLVPNALPPIIVQLSLSISFGILAEASLSFLGLSEPPPAPGWGIMLNSGRGYLEQAPWLSVFPGLAIAIAVLSFNVLGDALRDQLDPRLARVPEKDTLR